MTNDKADAAERRQDYLRALEFERTGCVQVGKTDRVKAIDAEIARLRGAPVDATPAKRTTRAAAAADGVDDQV